MYKVMTSTSMVMAWDFRIRNEEVRRNAGNLPMLLFHVQIVPGREVAGGKFPLGSLIGRLGSWQGLCAISFDGIGPSSPQPQTLHPLCSIPISISLLLFFFLWLL